MHPEKSVMIPDHKLKKYSSKGLAKYALEVDLGWFQKHKIKPGMTFSWSSPK